MADKRLAYLTKRPKRSRTQETARPKNLRVKITSDGPLSFEELTAAIQKAFARLEGRGASSATNCSLYLALRNSGGASMELKDEAGQPLETLEIRA
jgi:hypothetical protein